MSAFTAMLELLSIGWTPIPIATDAHRSPAPFKAPLEKWDEYVTTPPTAERVTYWKARYTDVNVAILTGSSSGVVVLDLDTEEAHDALYTELEIPRTVKSRTGKGYHLFFECPDWPVRNGVRVRPGVDTRGDRGYVIVPPSRHESGRTYEWIVSPFDQAPEPIPPALLPLFSKWGDQHYRYAVKALENELQEVLNAKEGTRNHTLNRSAFNCFQLVSGGCIVRDRVYDALFDAAGSIGLQDAEIRDTLASAEKAAEKKPRTPDNFLKNGHHPNVFDDRSDDEPHGTRLTVSQIVSRSVSTPPPSESAVLKGSADVSAGDSPTPPSAPPPPPATLPRRELSDPNRFLLDDVGNADRLIALHGDKLLYNFTSSTRSDDGWLIWDGVRWLPCAKGEHRELAIDTTVSILEQVDAEEDKGKALALARHAKYSRGAGGIRNMLWTAQSNESIRVTQDNLDADPLLINCHSGTIDLRQFENVDDQLQGATIIRPHSPDDRMTKTLRAEWDMTADYTRWLDFLHKIYDGDTELIEFLQRSIGYSLTGLTTEQKLFFLIGAGRNGKTVFREALRFLWGDYASETPFDTFIPRRQPGAPRPDLADLHGARLVVASEGPENTKLDEAMIKELTGGEALKTRRLNENFFTFKPQAKFWLATNHKPAISGNDDGIWRRILLIEHKVQIAHNETDPLLLDKLQADSTAILRWAIEGYYKYLKAGGLVPPQSVIVATETYRMEQDSIGAFIEEKCVVEPGVQVSKGDFYKAFREWSIEAGETNRSAKWLGIRLKERAHKLQLDEDNVAGIGRVWKGIRLATGSELGAASARNHIGSADDPDPLPTPTKGDNT